MPRFKPINKLLVVDRDKFELTLYHKHLFTAQFHVHSKYPIAVGAKGFSTPRGLFLINSRSRKPQWMVPNSQWAIEAGLKPGTILEFNDPANPIKERWLGVTDPKDGVGIHGTAAIESIGTRASHGCIRMLPDDVIKLYDQVPKYTPIYII